MTNYDSSILSLFPTTTSDSGMSSILSDYASIKNGSYGKLLKSYYAQEMEGSSSKSSSSSKDYVRELQQEKQNPTISKEAQNANSTLASSLSSIKSSVANLQKSSTYEDTEGGKTASDKIASSVKSFVTDYNNAVTSSKKSTSGASTSVASMMQVTSDNKDALKEIGISINSDGTLTMDEKAVKAADKDKVKNLFSSENSMSYGSKILNRANTAGYSSGTASSAGSTSSSKTSSSAKADAATATESKTSSTGLKEDAKSLASKDLYKTTKNESGEETYDTDKILSTAKSFVKNYNDTLSSAKNIGNSGVSSNLSSIISKTKANSDALSEIGISVSKTGTLSLDESKFKSAGMDKVQDAFKNYGDSVATSAQLVNYYTTTQASAANDYTKNGTYNTSALSSYFESV